MHIMLSGHERHYVVLTFLSDIVHTQNFEPSFQSSNPGLLLGPQAPTVLTLHFPLTKLHFSKSDVWCGCEGEQILLVPGHNIPVDTSKAAVCSITKGCSSACTAPAV